MLAVKDVKKGSAAETAGFEPGMVLTSVNGTRLVNESETSEEDKAAKQAEFMQNFGIPVTLGFDEPLDSLLHQKQLGRSQCREMVRIQLELSGRDPTVSDEWIDALFHEFDADLLGLIDDDEWDSLAAALQTRATDALQTRATDAGEHTRNLQHTIFMISRVVAKRGCLWRRRWRARSSRADIMRGGAYGASDERLVPRHAQRAQAHAGDKRFAGGDGCEEEQLDGGLQAGGSGPHVTPLPELGCAACTCKGVVFTWRRCVG